MVRTRNQESQASGTALSGPRISEVPRLNLKGHPLAGKQTGFELIYDHNNRELDAALKNLKHFFPDLFAKLESYDAKVFVTDENLDEDILGQTNCKFMPTHKNYDVVPITREKGGPHKHDSPFRKNHVVDGEIVDLNTAANSPTLEFKVTEVYVRISSKNINTSLAISGAIRKVYMKKYLGTLAHELLGHALHSLSNPVGEVIWNAIHDQMTQTRWGLGHEKFNQDGINAYAIGDLVKKRFSEIVKDPAFIPF